MLNNSTGLQVRGHFNLSAKNLIGEIIQQTKICQLPLTKTAENNKITEFTIYTHPVYIFSYLHGTIEEIENESLLEARISAIVPLGSIVNLLFQKIVLLLLAFLIIISIILMYYNPLLVEGVILFYFGVTLLYLAAVVIILQNIYVKTKVDRALNNYKSR